MSEKIKRSNVYFSFQIFSLDEDTSLIFNQTLSYINSSLPSLVGVATIYDDTIDNINNYSSLLMSSVGMATNIPSVLQEISNQETLLNQRVNRIHLCEFNFSMI